MAQDLMHGSRSAPVLPETSPHTPRGATTPSVARVEPTPDVKQRLLSLDTYRGLIMVTLAFNGFGLMATATNHLRKEGDSSFWRTIQYQFEHVEWTGCAYWDLIQPSFMFMVGAAMAYSYLKRRQIGASYASMLGHAVLRSLILIGLGIFLISNGQPTTSRSFMNVLTQIGLGYTFLFLLWGRSVFTQAVVAVLVLVGTWFLYESYAGAGVNLETGAPYTAGISKEWAQKHLTGLRPAWHKNANVGHAIDLWLLNQLPRPNLWPEPRAAVHTIGLMGALQGQGVMLAAPALILGGPQPYRYEAGGYQTINFLPSLATMLFGLMCGELLRSSRSARRKLQILFYAGIGGLLIGLLLDLTGICPSIKRIWTPSWALFSTGWCCLILASLYGLIDVLGYRRWTFPLVVVGVNSIAIYCMSMTLKGWAAGTWRTHFGADVFKAWGDLNEPMLQATMVGLAFWLACLWMYRQKIFVRI
jgi:predicted acyltransferase